MYTTANIQTLAARLVLFLILPVALWWGLVLLVPLSTTLLSVLLLTQYLFFPFLSHPSAPIHGFGMYIANGAFVVIVAFITVFAGRRFSVIASIGLFFGIAIAAALLTHAALDLLGFPIQVDLL